MTHTLLVLLGWGEGDSGRQIRGELCPMVSVLAPPMLLVFGALRARKAATS